jgi:hypothetical protein
MITAVDGEHKSAPLKSSKIQFFLGAYVSGTSHGITGGVSSGPATQELEKFAEDLNPLRIELLMARVEGGFLAEAIGQATA